MIQYDQNGLIIQSLLDILSERENSCQKIFGDDFYISGESVVANLQSADADREFSIQELLLYIANQLDPDQAEGIWLDYICALNNITRYKATKSTIPITVIGTAGTAKNTGEIIIVDAPVLVHRGHYSYCRACKNSLFHQIPPCIFNQSK